MSPSVLEHGLVGADSFVYLPTQCRMLLDLICHARPNHHLIIGDFDELPDVQVPGKNAPPVASKVYSLLTPVSDRMHNIIDGCQDIS